MDDNGLGNIIFYIILALIGLAGSLKGKKKKVLKPGEPKKTFSWPDFGDSTDHSFPDVFETKTTAKPAEKPAVKVVPVNPDPPVAKPRTYKPDPYIEGQFDEPMAGSFSGEGSYRNEMAEKYSSEGSMADDLASRYSHEGSIEDTMAGAFAGEGVSALAESQLKMSINNAEDNSSDEIFGYNYNADETQAENNENFSVRKAIIYSIILDRKEYSY